VRIVWKNNPLSFHPLALPAARAAMAAHEQGKFWEYHDKLFANQPRFQPDQLLQYAREVGLDVNRFQADLNSAGGGAGINADAAEANALGATGTPAFFINGRFLSGARPFQDFAQIINAELQRLNIPIPPSAQTGG
jgi:protein-disulfide isomerase